MALDLGSRDHCSVTDAPLPTNSNFPMHTKLTAFAMITWWRCPPADSSEPALLWGGEGRGEYFKSLLPAALGLYKTFFREHTNHI